MAVRLRTVQTVKPLDSVKPRLQRALETKNMQEVFDSLTEKQRRFVEEYMVDFDGTNAVLRAGYNCKHANRLAYQMLQNPAIKASIDYLSVQRASESVIKPDYVIKKITKTIEKAEEDNNHTAVLRGCELLARHLGMFIERQEISGPNGDAIAFKQVEEAANAFTSAITRLIERGGEGESTLGAKPENKGPPKVPLALLG